MQHGGDELVCTAPSSPRTSAALDWVRLGDVGDADEEGGASSTWFEATRCAIVAEPQTIRCAFPPGGGRELPVRVSIGGQRSAPTAASATVRTPRVTIARVAPNLTATDEDAVTLTGANLGVGALLAVQWDGVGAPLPIVAPSDGASIVVRSPPGTGRDHTLVAVHMLGTPFAQRSAPASVHYAPPRIHDVARRGDAAAGRLALFVLGENFGSTPGAVVDASELAKRQNGGAPEPCAVVLGSWSHRDLVCTLASDRELATLVVTVDGQRSEPAVCGGATPPSCAASSAPTAAPSTSFPTRGGAELVVVGERFGSVESPRPIAIAARYGEEGVERADAYRAACRVSVEFSEARCTTAAGLGVLRWTLRVEGEDGRRRRRRDELRAADGAPRRGDRRAQAVRASRGRRRAAHPRRQLRSARRGAAARPLLRAARRRARRG